MREALGEVSDEALPIRVVLLGEEAHVVPYGEKAIEDLARFGVAALEGEVVGEPERAREEGAFPRRQAVDFGHG